MHAGNVALNAGVMLLGVLSVATEGDYRSANVTNKPARSVWAPTAVHAPTDTHDTPLNPFSGRL